MAEVSLCQSLISIPAVGISIYSSMLSARNPIGVSMLPQTGGITGVSINQSAPAGCSTYISRDRRPFNAIVGVSPSPILGHYSYLIPQSGLSDWYVAVEDTLWYQDLLSLTKSVSSATAGRLPYRSYGLSPDLLDGDMLIKDKNGGGLFIGNTEVQLKLGSLASFLINGNYNSITEYALTHHLLGLTYLRHISPNIIKEYIASSMNLSLGVPNGVPAYTVKLKSELTLTLQGLKSTDLIYLSHTISIDAKAKPFFRQQTFKGLSVNGLLLNIFIADTKDNLKVYNLKSNIYAVASKQLRLNGLIISRSANSISNIKTPNIPALTSMCKLGLRLKYDAEVINQLQALLKNTLIDFNQNLPLFYKLILKVSTLDLVYLYPDDLLLAAFLLDVCISKNKLFNTDSVKKTNVTDTQLLLALVLKKTITNTSTGLTTLYYNNTSMITHAADGSIFIRDGWGSLIRMSRGNIIISSALDTIIRPGRNLIGLIPGTIDFTANNDVVLSTTLNINIGACKNAVLASGIDGSVGRTTILNKTNTEKDAKLLDNTKTGVIIRSSCSINQVAYGNIHIGTRYTPDFPGSSPTNGNKITIDGCSEFILHSERSIALISEEISGYTKNSAIIIQQNQALIKTSTITIDSTVRLSEISNINYIINDELKRSIFEYKDRTNSTRSLYIANDITCKALAAANSISTNGVILGDQYQTFLWKNMQIMPIKDQVLKNTKKSIITNATSQSTPIKVDINNLYIMTGCLTVSDRLAGLFTFHNYQYTQNILPGMCWQSDADGNAFKSITISTLQQSPDDKSISYPGDTKNVFITTINNQQIKKLKFEDNYKTNSHKEN